MDTQFLFGKPVTEIITMRKSVRTYLDKPLTLDIRAKLMNFFPCLNGPFPVSIRFELVDSDIARNTSQAKLGTYGVIKGASTYLVAAVEKKDRNLEQFGYAFEKMVLFATSLGLGTCWLGGTFKIKEFAKAIDLKNYEILPCVSPVGYPGQRQSILEKMMRYSAGSENRKGWQELFFQEDFSHTLNQTESGEYQTPLEMLRLAPSASNKQPWRVIKDHNRFHFYLAHTKGYAKLLPLDLQKVDMGIAMCHFELTAKEMGMRGKWVCCDPGICTPDNTEYISTWYGYT
jgi:hypothetical protein